jgi:hypothetical protein
MMNLGGLLPTDIKRLHNCMYLEWMANGQRSETTFDRFRPTDIKVMPEHELRIEWRDFGELLFDEPFFRHTQEKAADDNLLARPFYTDLNTLVGVAAQQGVLPICGAVFHMGRSGSTLVHRLLSCAGPVMSIAELPVVDRALRVSASWEPDGRALLLRALIGAFGRPRRGTEQYFVLKMADAMPNMRIKSFLKAFPDLPWIFVYREPIEVLVSLIHGPNGTMRTWLKNRATVAERLGMPIFADARLDLEMFAVVMIREFCKKVLESATRAPAGSFLAVPYHRLPEAIWESIAPHFGISLCPEHRELMRTQGRLHSKKVDNLEFVPDSLWKQAAATARIRKFAADELCPLYDRLKSLPQG